LLVDVGVIEDEKMWKREREVIDNQMRVCGLK